MMKWIAAVLLAPLAIAGAPAAQTINLEQEQLARWHINYASYLIDVGKYMEALENYHTAIEISGVSRTKSDALLAKATLLSSFLDAEEEALKTYREIRKGFPDGAEIAIYREGLLLFELNRYGEAAEAFKMYLARYPGGRFQFQAEALMEKVKEAIGKIPPPPPAEPPPTLKPTPERSPPTAKPALAPKPSSPPEKPAAVPAPSPKPTAAPGAARPEVRVRISAAAKEVMIRGTGVCADGFGCKDSFTVTPLGSRVTVNGRQTGSGSLLFKSTHPLQVTSGEKNMKLRGNLWIKANEGKLLVVNLVDMEDYLLSVVPSESYPSWPLDTLKAQAVAARTYAYYQKLHRENLDYDLVDDEGDQAYKGMDREQPRSTQAVKESSGEILTHQKKTILAMFSANSGGHTADAKAVFNLDRAYLSARPDPESLKGKMARWTKELTLAEIESSLGKIGITARQIQQIEPAEKGSCGRITKVRIRSADGDQVFRTRTTLRRALSLPEILLDMKKQGNKYIFEGRGWGHGVGYSQWGSAVMGKDTSYRDILAFYYPGTTLEKKWQ